MKSILNPEIFDDNLSDENTLSDYDEYNYTSSGGSSDDDADYDTSDYEDEIKQNIPKDKPLLKQNSALITRDIINSSSNASLKASSNKVLDDIHQTDDIHKILFKGRKYNWQAKLNLHVHLIEHTSLDCVELIVYNTSMMMEAPHVYLKLSRMLKRTIFQQIDLDSNIIKDILNDYKKHHPNDHLVDSKVIERAAKTNALATYIADRIVPMIQNNIFTVDVRDTYSSTTSSFGTKGTTGDKDTDDNASELSSRSINSRGMINTVTNTTQTVIQEKNELQLQGKVDNELEKQQPPSQPFLANDTPVHDRRRSGRLVSSLDSTVLNMIHNQPFVSNDSPRIAPLRHRSGGSVINSLNRSIFDGSAAADPSNIVRRTSNAIRSSVFSNTPGNNTTHNIAKDILNNLQVKTKSLLCKKPPALIELQIRRFGKSTTLVGQVVGEKTNKTDDEIQKLINRYNLHAILPKSFLDPTAVIKGGTIASTFEERYNINKKTPVFKVIQSTFNKFGKDKDLFLESLSYIHISEYLLLQCVCKKWKTIISKYLQSITNLDISSRDYNFYAHSQAILQQQQNNNNNTQYSIFQSKVRVIFVRENTVDKLLNLSLRKLQYLKLNYVILNRKIISGLQTLNGYLKHLSLGIIKFDDNNELEHTKSTSSLHEIIPIKTPHTTTGNKDLGNKDLGLIPQRPNQNPGTTKRSGPIIRRSSIHITNNNSKPINTTEVITKGTGGIEASKQVVPDSNSNNESSKNSIRSKRLSVTISEFRLINGTDVQDILQACGRELTHLEINVNIGEIPMAAFSYVPKLISLVALESFIAPRVTTTRRDLQGYIEVSEYEASLKKILMPDLLSLMSDSSQEAMLLTDKSCRICVVNEAFEKLTGYTNRQVYKHKIDFLKGTLTDLVDFDRLKESMKHQISTQSTTTFLHTPDKLAYLAQIIFIPNVAKFRGKPLDFNALSEEFISHLALDLEDKNVSFSDINLQTSSQKRATNMKDWLLGMRELSYHLVRFGSLSEPFSPTSAAIVKALQEKKQYLQSTASVISSEFVDKSNSNHNSNNQNSNNRRHASKNSSSKSKIATSTTDESEVLPLK